MRIIVWANLSLLFLTINALPTNCDLVYLLFTIAGQIESTCLDYASIKDLDLSFSGNMNWNSHCVISSR